MPTASEPQTPASPALSAALTAVELGLLRLPGMARLRGDRREAAAAEILQRLAEAGVLAGIPEYGAPAALAAA